MLLSRILTGQELRRTETEQRRGRNCGDNYLQAEMISELSVDFPSCEAHSSHDTNYHEATVMVTCVKNATRRFALQAALSGSGQSGLQAAPNQYADMLRRGNDRA